MGNIYIPNDILDDFGEVRLKSGWYWFVRFFDKKRIVVRSTEGKGFVTVIPMSKVDYEKWT